MASDTEYGNPIGAINVYTCEKCGKKLCTIHADHGTTPFMIVCKRTRGCKGFATSGFYRPTQLVPFAEWYRPGADDPCMSDPDIKDHVTRGGLMLRMKEGMTP